MEKKLQQEKSRNVEKKFRGTDTEIFYKKIYFLNDFSNIYLLNKISHKITIKNQIRKI